MLLPCLLWHATWSGTVAFGFHEPFNMLIMLVNLVFLFSLIIWHIVVDPCFFLFLLFIVVKELRLSEIIPWSFFTGTRRGTSIDHSNISDAGNRRSCWGPQFPRSACQLCWNNIPLPQSPRSPSALTLLPAMASGKEEISNALMVRVQLQLEHWRRGRPWTVKRRCGALAAVEVHTADNGQGIHPVLRPCPS